MTITENTKQDVLPEMQNDYLNFTDAELPTAEEETEPLTLPEPYAVPEPANSELTNVTLPPKSKKRGRPKGSSNNVLGLPKKKSRLDKPIPFIKKSSNDRDLQILGYFVSGKDAIRAMSGELLTENTVEQNLSSIPRACLDENVSINKIRRYFDPDGWKAVEHVYGAVKLSAQWMCELCRQNLNKMDSVVCDCCLQWVHLKCIGKRTYPKGKFWICRDCYA